MKTKGGSIKGELIFSNHILLPDANKQKAFHNSNVFFLHLLTFIHCFEYFVLFDEKILNLKVVRFIKFK